MYKTKFVLIVNKSYLIGLTTKKKTKRADKRMDE